MSVYFIDLISRVSEIKKKKLLRPENVSRGAVMFKKIALKITGFFPALPLLISGCMTAAQHQQNLHSTAEREMTVGVVQKEIRVGMSQADVVTALGSPNMVTRDGEGKETWVYDKIASEASYSSDSGGVSGGVGAGGVAGSTLILGLIGGGYSRAAGAASTTQKTLTVVLKFGRDSQLESFSYNSSKF